MINFFNRYFPILLCIGLVLALLPKTEHYFYLYTDDYKILSEFVQPQPLVEKNLIEAQSSFIGKLSNTFQFFSEKTGSLQSLEEYGAMPWWTESNMRMHMFRPVSGLTYWIDAQFLFPNLKLIQLHNIFWGVVLALSAMIFYRQFCGTDRKVQQLATLLFVFNLALILSFYWLAARNSLIAVIFTFWTLIFHKLWREEKRIIYCFASLTTLALGLLSAEAGFAAAMYLGAYAIAYDNDGIKKGLLWLIPAATLTVLWRITYQHYEFGADNISLYIDPIRNFPGFIKNIFVTGPLLFLSQILSINIPYHLPRQGFAGLILFAYLLLLAGTVLIWPLARKNKAVSFLVLGSCFSILPFCSYATIQLRNAVMIAIGFSGAIAILIPHLWQMTTKKFNRIFFRSAIVFFITVKALLVVPHIVIAFAPQIMSQANRSLDYFIRENKPVSDTPIIYLSIPSIWHMIHQPYRWALEGLPLPKQLFILAMGVNEYTILRESNQTYILESAENFVINEKSPITRESNTINETDLNRQKVGKSLRIVTSGNEQFNPGDQIEHNGLQVIVLATKNNAPSKLKITFASDIVSDSLIWQQWDWQERRLEQVQPLKVGELRTIGLAPIPDNLYQPSN